MSQVTTQPSINQIWEWLDAVPDPEIPVISLVDLGIIRDVAWEGETLVVTVTPTYSGCPATDVISEDVTSAVRAVEPGARVEVVLSPAWTTDWILPSAHEKMREHGIAPPEQASADRAFLTGEGKIIPCPRCGSRDTKMVSAFGSTACKAHFTCTSCLEPFDHFKCF